MGDNTYGYDDCLECDGQGQIERYQRDPTSAPIYYECEDCGKEINLTSSTNSQDED